MSIPEPDDAGKPVQVGGSFLTGVAWMLGFRLFDRVAGVVSTLILARLLLPEHFGIVALASTVVAFVELLAALGLDTVLIQKRELTRGHYDTAWTIQLAVATLCASLLALAAHPASGFFREARLEPVVYLLAVSMFIEGWQNIRLVDFRREMAFDREFRFLAARRVFALAVTIALAFVLRNHWALAIGIVTSRFIGVVLSYLMRPYLPRFSLEHRREFVGKSSWLLFSSLAMFIRSRTSDIVLGRVGGPGVVGTYNLASDVANLVGQELVGPVNRVALPDFSRQGSKEEIRNRFDTMTGQVAIFLAPLGAGVAACADILVPVLFGPAWVAASDVLWFLAWAALVAALASNIGIAFISLGGFRANMAIHAIGAVTLVPLLLLGAQMAGAKGAAAAVLVGNIVTVFASLIYSRWALDYGPLKFCYRIWRPIVAAVVMHLAITWLSFRLGDPDLAMGDLVRLALLVVAGAVIYPLLLSILWVASGRPREAETLLVSVLADKLKSRSRSRGNRSATPPGD